MKLATLSVLEQPGSRAQQLARQIFAYGRTLTLEETIARIDAVDASAARAAGAAMLRSRADSGGDRAGRQGLACGKSRPSARISVI